MSEDVQQQQIAEDAHLGQPELKKPRLDNDSPDQLPSSENSASISTAATGSESTTAATTDATADSAAVGGSETTVDGSKDAEEVTGVTQATEAEKPVENITVEATGGSGADKSSHSSHNVQSTDEQASDTSPPEKDVEKASEAAKDVEMTDAPAETASAPAGTTPGPTSEATSESAKKPAEAEAAIKTDQTAKEAANPLEAARKAADNARVSMLPELDPTDPPEKGTGLPKHQHKYALSAIRAIKRLKDAMPFLYPVDPVKQGVPQYFDYITVPMDLGTIEKKLVSNEYDTVREMVDDFSQLIWNCIYFNGEESLISKMALAIAQSFTKQLSNMPTYDDSKKSAVTATAHSDGTTSSAASGPAPTTAVSATTADPAASAHSPGAAGATSAIDDHHSSTDAKRSSRSAAAGGAVPLRRKSMADGRPKREIRPPRPRDLTYEQRPRNKKFAAELKFCGQILKEFQSRKLEPIAFPFLLPVDPVEQGVPHYLEIIKEPMDLSTMQRKLNEGHYYNSEEFEADMRLMFRNCYTFNPEGTPVNVLGHKLEDEFDKRWIDKPQPAPTPPPMDEGSDFESDYDDEYDEAGISNPAISVLEAQLKSMKRELTRLKREALEEWRNRGKRKRAHTSASSHVGGSGNGHGHGSGGHGGHQRRLSSAPKLKDSEPMTFEQKQELSKKIETLPEKKLRTVIAIIQESMPSLRNSGQDEIELDMDQLEPKTLRKLYNFVVLQRRESSGGGANSGHGSSPAHSHPAGSPNGTKNGGSVSGDDSLGGAGVPKKRKSKPLSEEEHNRQIEEIQNKLRQFDAATNGSPGAIAAPAVDADSSSDEEDARLGLAQSSDDSSSEEE